MVLSWVSAGLHLGVSVGLGDFCVNPDAYIERIGSKNIEAGKKKEHLELEMLSRETAISFSMKMHTHTRKP